jgi:carbon monoxide dehydrogenase subunit G
MIHVASYRSIPASPEACFAFLDRPENHERITPALAEAVEIGRLPSGGTRARFRYRMLGLSFSGEIRAVTHEPPSVICYEMSGALNGFIRIELTRAADGTVATYSSDFDLRPRWVAVLFGPLLRAVNRRQIERLLLRLEEHVASR